MGRLEIKAYGTVRSGWLEYAVNGDTLTYTGVITVKVFLSTKTVPIAGTVTELAAFKTGSYLNPGVGGQFGQVTTKVDSIDTAQQLSNIEINYPPLKLSGIVALHTAGGPTSDISIAGVHLVAEVHGITLHVVAAEAQHLAGLAHLGD